MTILDAVPPEGSEITVVQLRLAPLSFTHWNSSRFLESFNYVMHCWRWNIQISSYLSLRNIVFTSLLALNCSCPNFFWNVLQVWMTGKDVYLQMTWSWPDKTWNILCSYCLQWNTSQSKFRNHYFLFLFAFSILSQLFLIWGCIYIYIFFFFHLFIYIYIYAFSRRFYPKWLTLHSSYSFFLHFISSIFNYLSLVVSIISP